MILSNRKNSLNFAYTMAEILVVIGIIGVLAVIIMPIIIHAMPTKEEKMHQKMSYLIEQLALHLYDNEAYYPRTSDVTKLGFKNTDEVTVDGVKYGGGISTSLARKQKFCKLFAHQFNGVDHGTVVCLDNIESQSPSFRSSEGVDWWIPKTTFEESDNGQIKGFVKIKIDVNGYDKGQNCTEGSVGCTKPDVFYYYIKTNGSITLSNPVCVNDDTYEIIPIITTKDVNGNEISAAGGTVEIAPVNTDGSFGTFSSASSSFDNLSANTSYELRAKPAAGYISDWGTRNTNVSSEKRYGYKKVRTTKLKNEVAVEFRQVPTYCIKLKVNCPSDNINDCISTKQYKYNCKFNAVNQGLGDYNKPYTNLDSYEYVGMGYGNYVYSCSNTGTLTVGSEATNDAGYLKVCGLETGDYQLYVTPATGLHVYPLNGEYYSQNVRLGTSDIDDFEVEIRY